MAGVQELRRAAEQYARRAPHLGEGSRRLLIASEALALGPRSDAALARATGVSPHLIGRGIRELQSPEKLPPGRVRKAGGGRKKAIDKYPALLADLERLVEPGSRGEPMSPLRWTSKSTAKLAAELTAMGYPVGASLVRRLLHQLGYSLQANRKTIEGTAHPDRNPRFGQSMPPRRRDCGSRTGRLRRAYTPTSA